MDEETERFDIEVHRPLPSEVGGLLTASDLARIRCLMEASFPVVELPPESSYAAMLTDERMVIFAHRAEGGRGAIDSVAITRLLGEQAVILEYLVTDETIRGQGLGGRLLDGVTGSFDGRMVLAEIELPESAPMALRRAGFYERHGFCLNRGEYFQPPMKDGDKPLPMLLISHLHPLSGAAFDDARSLVYQQEYGLASKRDARP